MQPRFELSPEPLLMSGLGRLARYGTHQKTISGGPEQKYLSSDPRLEWPRPAEGPLFKPAYAFISFKLPILTDKSLNIAATKIRKEVQKGNKLKDFVGMKFKFQIIFLDL